MECTTNWGKKGKEMRKKKKCIITFDDIQNISCDIPGWFERYVKDRLKKAGFKETDAYIMYYDIPGACYVYEGYKPC